MLTLRAKEINIIIDSLKHVLDVKKYIMNTVSFDNEALVRYCSTVYKEIIAVEELIMALDVSLKLEKKPYSITVNVK